MFWLRRLQRRRRLLREELLAVADSRPLPSAATLTVLGLQWLDSGPSANSAAVSAPAQTLTSPGGLT